MFNSNRLIFLFYIVYNPHCQIFNNFIFNFLQTRFAGVILVSLLFFAILLPVFV